MAGVAQRERNIGLLGATGIGVGAIVGGGILALAGVAFATTGPAAILAFALNGVIALLTALSFAEMSSKFPESGGTYAFARRILSVQSAFTVGWVVWFASIVAAALYAIGFAVFCAIILADVCRALDVNPGTWMTPKQVVLTISIVTTAIVAFTLVLRESGGGKWINIGKVAVFGVLIATGLWALTGQTSTSIQTTLKPFFSAGMVGLLQAMGYTFIALQGFDLIAAVGGRVRNPARNIPLGMVLSLGIALAIYLPLLFVVSTAGVPEGENIRDLAVSQTEQIVAIAAENFLGSFGYWLVMVAAVLSMLSALQANLFAAAWIARSMARDHTLPASLATLHSRFGTPLAAVVVTAVLSITIQLLVSNVSNAGAAASLIFLVTFALAHWLAILLRLRSRKRPPPFQSPFFPVIPVIGGLACMSLAVFQGLAVPAAGIIAGSWLIIGAFCFILLFARRARIVDASRSALEPEMLRLRGRSPLVLVPIANPNHAVGLLSLGKALAPPEVGRILLLSVVIPSKRWNPAADLRPLQDVQLVLSEALQASARIGVYPEAMTTVAPEAWPEIARVVATHRCESLVLGFRETPSEKSIANVNELIGQVDCDVVMLRAPDAWPPREGVKRILVPVAGRGRHDELLARLLGSFVRTAEREIKFLRVVSQNSNNKSVRRAQRELKEMARDHAVPDAEIEVVKSDSPGTIIAAQAAQNELTVLGVKRTGKRQTLIGEFTLKLVQATDCPMIFISRHG